MNPGGCSRVWIAKAKMLHCLAKIFGLHLRSCGEVQMTRVLVARLSGNHRNSHDRGRLWSDVSIPEGRIGKVVNAVFGTQRKDLLLIISMVSLINQTVVSGVRHLDWWWLMVVEFGTLWFGFLLDNTVPYGSRISFTWILTTANLLSYVLHLKLFSVHLSAPVTGSAPLNVVSMFSYSQKVSAKWGKK